MAHELDTTSGKAALAMAEGSQTPWHGLGFSIDPTADLKKWRKAAGLNWQVEESPVVFKHKGSLAVMSDKKVLVRSDVGSPLSVVSSGYKTVQPEEVVEFFRDLVGAGGYQMNTMGSLRGGRKIWALADVGKSIELPGHDRVDGYLLVATSFDLSLPTVAMLTSVRVVCQNTLMMAIREGEKSTRPSLRVPHYANFNPEQVKVELGLIPGSWKAFAEDAKNMAKVKLTDPQALEFFCRVFGKVEEGEDVTPEMLADQSEAKTIKRVFELYKGGSPGSELKSAKDTLWGAVNGVTRWVDHVRGGDERRLDFSWFGNGKPVKTAAWDNAVELLKVA